MRPGIADRVRRRSHATVVAYLSLFVALSAGAYAASLPRNSVKSPTVKNNSLKSIDLKNGKGVKGIDVVDGTLLAENIKPGEVVTGFQYLETFETVEIGEVFGQANVVCPEGTVLVGGGGLVQDSDWRLTFVNLQGNNVYAVTAVGPAQGTAFQVAAKGVCAEFG